MPARASRIMGIDASSSAVAFSVFEDGRLLHYGKIYIAGGETTEQCGDVNKKMYHLMKLYEPEVVVMEQAIYVNNRGVVIKLANIFGAIIGVVVATGHRCEQVPPATWMAHIGNPTRNSKELIAEVKKKFPGKSKNWYTNKLREWRKDRTIAWVKDNHGVLLTDDDVADACALGAYGSELYA